MHYVASVPSLSVCQEEEEGARRGKKAKRSRFVDDMAAEDGGDEDDDDDEARSEHMELPGVSRCACQPSVDANDIANAPEHIYMTAVSAVLCR